MVFLRNENYFRKNMEKIAACGVSVLGACCGSSPEYIAELSGNLSAPLNSVECKGWGAACGDGEKTGWKEDDIWVHTENNRFLEQLQGKKVIAVELDPPYDADDAKIIAAAARLKELGADILTVADSPQGRSRMDSVLTAVKLMAVTRMPVMPHICCRDKNMISMRSVLLGAYANGIRNFLFVTGDPVPIQLRSSATGVFDYNSVKLMEFAREMNREHFQNEPMVYGGALNQGRINFSVEISRAQKKIDAGASYFLTQPVYGREDIERLFLLKQKLKTKLLAGIMPLVSYRNANFVKNEMVGINIPDKVLLKYHPDMGREEGEQVGIRISLEVMEQMNDFVDGYYFMLPFNRVGLMEGILRGMKK